jgi:hypothetical protein
MRWRPCGAYPREEVAAQLSPKAFQLAYLYDIPYDTTTFIDVSIREVVKTLGRSHIVGDTGCFCLFAELACNAHSRRWLCLFP